MYGALKVSAIIIKLLALVIFAGAVVLAFFFAVSTIEFLRSLGVVGGNDLVILVAVAFAFVGLIIAVFTYAAGEIIDVLISIEKSVYTLRESASGMTPLHVSAHRSSRPVAPPGPNQPMNVWEPGFE